ncbi:hypothetical protein ASF56_22450 [Methylobacterium sp. Leaf122]|nr:hypothetical protein ASF56_22450 [Methylobacterium sp. Leaf122]
MPYQTVSPEIALGRVRTLEELRRQDVTTRDMNDRVYEVDTFHTCFVRSGSDGAPTTLWLLRLLTTTF